MFRKLLLNSQGIILPSGAEVFDVLVAKRTFNTQPPVIYIGCSDDMPNSSIQPNIFMGIGIKYFYVSTTAFMPGTWLNIQDSQPVQHITVIRLDTGLTIKLEKYFLDYHSDQLIFSDEDVGKTIKVALLAN